MANIFSQNWQRRIENAVRAVEDAPPLPAPPLPAAETWFVEITSTTQTDGRYPGNGRRYSATAKTWADEEDCWVVDANGAALVTGRQYLARLWQSGIGSPAKPVLITDRDSGDAQSVTTATISTGQNDYAVPTDVLAVNPSSSFAFTGFEAPDSGSRVIEIINTGSNTISFTSESASSTAANRIYNPSGFALTGRQSGYLIYDTVNSRWNVAFPASVSGITNGSVSGQFWRMNEAGNAQVWRGNANDFLVDITITAAQNGESWRHTSATPHAVTLPAVADCGNNWYAYFYNDNSGLVTVSVPSGSFLHGTASFTLEQDECALVHTTGAGGFGVYRSWGNTLSGSRLTDATVTYAKIQNLDAVSVLARSANSSGVSASLAAAANGNFLRRRSNALSFGNAWLTTTKSANFTADTEDHVYYDVDASGGAITATLPAAASNAGLVIAIEKSDSSANAVTVDANGAELIDGATTQIIGKQHEVMILICDGTGWSRLVKNVREQLTAARTYYVRTDGSNSNTGLADTAGGAFLTIQKAIDTVASIDLGTYAVTIQVRSGTYTGAVVVNGPWLGSGTVTLTGDTSTPSNVVISVAGDAVSVKNFAALRISGFKITTTTGFSNCLYILDNGTATITNSMEFGAATGAHIYASNGGNIVVSAGAIAVTGNAYGILLAQAAGRITFGSITVTLTGTPAFTTTVQCDQSSYAGLSAVTFSGGATGTRYSVSSNSVIASDGSGANFIPGNAAGSATTGGQYV
jgi:hypothetical protein